MFAGTKIKIGDEEFVVPALSLGQLRSGVLTQLQEHDSLLAEGKTFEAMDIRAKVVFEALKRNYPDFNEQKLIDFLDMQNIGTIWLAVLGVSGFTPGEAMAGTETGNGISNPSTVA